MPIIGLTDRSPSFKELGRLRLGIPKAEAAVGGPKEIGYFRVDFRPDTSEEVRDLFTAKYKAQPTQINVRFPFNEVSRIWDAYYMAYNKSGLLGMSDGQKWLYLRNNQTGELLVKDGMSSKVDGLPTDANGMPYLPFNKSIPVYSYKSQKGQDVAVYARPEGRLKILIPELKQAAYMTVITHSVYNVMRISEQLAGIEQIAKNAGMSLPMVPVILSRRKEMISVSINGQKSMQEHYLLNVEIDPEWMEAQFKFLNALLPGVTPLPMQLALPAWTDGAVAPEDLSEDETGEETTTTATTTAAAGHGSNGNSGTNGMSYMTAINTKTPKGNQLGNLTDEQLTTLQLKADGDVQKAAAYLLGVASAEAGDYGNYFSFVSLATDKGIEVPPMPEKMTRIQVWRELQKLIEVVK